MPYHYDTDDEAKQKALPNIETFYIRGPVKGWKITETYLSEGWYWWTCLPGCLPDSEPNGPFATEAEALADAREGIDE